MKMYLVILDTLHDSYFYFEITFSLALSSLVDHLIKIDFHARWGYSMSWLTKPMSFMPYLSVTIVQYIAMYRGWRVFVRFLEMYTSRIFDWLFVQEEILPFSQSFLILL